LKSEKPWTNSAQLGPVGVLCALFRRVSIDDCDEIKDSVIQRLQDLTKLDIDKFSKLNDPDFAFGVAIGFSQWLPDELRQWLADRFVANSQTSNIRRAVLFAAAGKELNVSLAPLVFDPNKMQSYDLIPAIWLAENYPDLIEGEERRRGLWEAFEHVKNGIGLDDDIDASGSLYTASTIDVAMLYEAVQNQTREPNPVTLFRNIPFHPDVQLAAKSLFCNGEYVNAVFEAGKLFIDAVKHKAGNPVDKFGKPLDGATLMNNVFSSKPPKLKFNPLANLADQNEQTGLSMIAQGIAIGLRNPKGHQPKAAIQLGPYEALEQLAIISYLMNRLDTSTP
jgi:uncharacterized protein (TIGR02391 family)